MEIERDFMDQVHKAKGMLEIGLEQYSRRELKEMYTFMVSLGVTYHRCFVKPFADALDENPEMRPVPGEDT